MSPLTRGTSCPVQFEILTVCMCAFKSKLKPHLFKQAFIYYIDYTLYTISFVLHRAHLQVVFTRLLTYISRILVLQSTGVNQTNGNGSAIASPKRDDRQRHRGTNVPSTSFDMLFRGNFVVDMTLRTAAAVASAVAASAAAMGDELPFAQNLQPSLTASASAAAVLPPFQLSSSSCTGGAVGACGDVASADDVVTFERASYDNDAFSVSRPTWLVGL